jgi:Domain of unknown function (DUF4397)
MVTYRPLGCLDKENTIMKLKHSLALLVRCISLVLGVLALVGLFGLQVRPASADSPAFVRVAHASPDIGTADVFLDETKVLSNFEFGTITDYVTKPPGPHKVQVALIGKGVGASVITQTLSVNPGVAYIVVGLGTQSTGFSLEVFIDNNQLSTGIAKLRVYNLSPNTNAVNVSIGGNMVVSGLSYQQASNYVTVAAGSYTFNVTATQPDVTLPLSETLNANTVTSIFAVGLVNGSPQFQLKAAQVAGIPGLPLTGSDPNAVPGQTQPLTPWLLGALTFVVIGTGVATRRLVRAHQKIKVRSSK